MNNKLPKILYSSLAFLFLLSFSFSTSAQTINLLETDSQMIDSSEEVQKELHYSQAVINKHIKYRTSNNLNSSEEAIQKAIQSENAIDTISKYGVALTAEEEEYISTRDMLMDKHGDKIGERIFIKVEKT